MRCDSIRQVSFLLPLRAVVEERTWQPPVDVYTTADGWLIKFDLAGVRPDDIQLTFEGTRLIVAGSRRDCSLEEGCRHLQMEISYAHFERTIILPDDLQSAVIRTEHRDGMLLIRILKGTQA